MFDNYRSIKVGRKKASLYYAEKFTFQCVSIKVGKLLIPDGIELAFTFQCVSIKV